MSSCRSRVVSTLAALLLGAAGALAQPYAGIGRTATAKEIAAWDTDVRPDFKGLPAGSGSVRQGMELWESQCASCHGVFGESNEIFQPIVGGTTQADVASGRVASLRETAGSQGRTTLMKLSTLSTLWDYIQRAMPWNSPKSLTVDQTYAVTAYILNLGGIVTEDFVLSERNIREVQARLPNRLGKSPLHAHAMWPGTSAAPDVKAQACMKDCESASRIASSIPDYARNAHGNLAEQNRLVGAMRGMSTPGRPEGEYRGAQHEGTPVNTGAAQPARGSATASPVQALLKQHNCLACHGLDTKGVGPGLTDVAAKHAARADAPAYFEQRIVAGSSGVWGNIPMPAQSLPAADARTIAAWLAAGAK